MHVAMPGLVDGLTPISYVILCGIWIVTTLSIAGLLSNGLRRNRQLNLGLCYSSALPTINLSGLPSPARAAISARYNNFIGQDWGSVRAANGQTFDSCAIYFVHWVRGKCFNYKSLQQTTPEQAVMLISAFMEDVHHGKSLKNTKNPSNKTIQGYMTSAAEAWKAITGMTVPLYEDPKDGKHAKLKPIIGDILSQHRNWKPTKEKQEPYTFVMFQALNDLLCQMIVDDGSVLLQERYAIFDWARLGIFTSSRLAEYRQSKLTPGALFATVPRTIHATEWARSPLAFICDDFTFYDDKFVQLS
jgi:hypothetical protein